MDDQLLDGKPDNEHEDVKIKLGRVRRFDTTRPFGRMAMFRQTLELFVRSWRSLLWWSSDRCEAKQKQCEFKAMRSNADPDKLHRSYAVLEAAKNVLENELHKDAAQLLEEHELWDHLMPPRGQTLENCMLAFEAISGAKCSVGASTGMQNRRCPVAIMRLLISQEEAGMLDRKKECLFSAWGGEVQGIRG